MTTTTSAASAEVARVLANAMWGWGMDEQSGRGGLSAVGVIGMGLAAYCSWAVNGSVVWACVHAFFGWFYVLYLCAGCGGGLPDGVL